MPLYNWRRFLAGANCDLHFTDLRSFFRQVGVRCYGDDLKMQKFLNFVLIFTGVAAAIAICCPMLVVLGFLALILPGLVLLTAPTVFVYLATAVGLQRMLTVKLGGASYPIAILLAIGLGWFVVQPIRSSAISEFRSNDLPDVIPREPIVLSGHVYVANDDLCRSPKCDYLCTMLLDLPGVQSVTIEGTDRNGRNHDQSVAAFALVRPGANAEPGVFPSRPGQLIRKHPALRRRVKGNDLTKVEKSLEADWALRLSGAERIVATKPIPVNEADWIVRLVSTHSKQNPRIERVEIARMGNDIRYRKSEIRHFVPGKLFYIGFDLRSAAAMSSNASFCLGGRDWRSSDQSINLESTLLEAIELPRLTKLDDARHRLRSEVQRAIDDPNASPARLELARRWLSLFFFDATEDDHALIARIVGDRRVKDIAGPIESVYSQGSTPIELAIAYAKRITFDDATVEERSLLAKDLASMPAGTFANPDPTYLDIWTHPELYEQAGPFLSRVADLGAPRAMPILRDALGHVATKDNWNQRRAMVEGIRDAYASLGPAAKQDAAMIRRLVLLRRSPITSGFKDVQAWRLTLAQMGVPIDDLPFFPHSSRQQINRTKSQIRDRLQRIQAEI